MSDADYAAAAVTTTIEVAPATLLVNAIDATKTAGDPDPAFSASISGFVLRESDAIVTGASNYVFAPGQHRHFDDRRSDEQHETAADDGDPDGGTSGHTGHAAGPMFSLTSVLLPIGIVLLIILLVGGGIFFVRRRSV